VTQNARFYEMATRWAEADSHALAYCTYLLGAPQTHADADLLALVHQAMLDEEDPGDLLTRHASSHLAEPMTLERTPAFA
jgi:hypothetical protein